MRSAGKKKAAGKKTPPQRKTSARPAPSKKASARKPAGDTGSLGERLRAVKFFEGYEAGAEQQALRWAQNARHWIEPARSRWPGLRLLSVHIDAECIEGPESYVELVKEFARGSFGLFRPRRVHCEWNRRASSFELSFQSGDGSFRAELPGGSDYVDEGFYALLNQAVAPLQFHSPKVGWGQDAGFLLATPGAYRRAHKAGLLPAREPIGDPPRQAPPSKQAPPPFPDAEGLFERLHKKKWFQGLPDDYARQSLPRMQAAAARGEHPACGLAVHRIPLDELSLELKGMEAHARDIQERAPWLLPCGTIQVRKASQRILEIATTHQGQAVVVKYPVGDARTSPLGWLTDLSFELLRRERGPAVALTFFVDARGTFWFFPARAGRIGGKWIKVDGVRWAGARDRWLLPNLWDLYAPDWSAGKIRQLVDRVPQFA